MTTLTTRSGQARIHHRDTVRDNNSPDNLELRLLHPAGNNRDNWIHLLELEGYEIRAPE